MKKSQYLKFKKQWKQKRKNWITKNKFFWIFVLFLVTSLIIFYLVCFNCFFQIKTKKIQVKGNQKVKTEDIKNLVDLCLPKKIIFWDSRSVFLVNLENLNEEILNYFPQIGEVFIQRQFPDKLIISVRERKPIGVVKQDNNYFFIDKEGVVFEKVNNQKNQWPEIVLPEVDKDLKIGRTIIEKNLISRIAEIEEELRKKEISLRSIKIVSSKRANVLTQEGWEVYFNLDDNISKQVFNLDLLLREKISPRERENLEYIDLRFGNQIFYK
ncbi:cell division protein FtsQ/DivIB [bacterium]|nr:cell division protein FtsQ/DivIB [bacterium]